MGKRYLLRMFAAILVAVVMIGPICGARAAESVAENTFAGIDYQKSDDIRVIIDGKQLVFDVKPQVVDNRTLVPMRTIFEAFGLTVTWDESTNTVTGKSDETVIILTIGSNKATVNGQERILDVPASVITGRTMIPLRFLSESMQYKVVWIGASNLILISKTDIIEWRYTGFEATAPYREYETKWINGVQTAQTRYTGKNHPVEIVTLYNADGRIITGLPDFSVPTYGAGWYLQSPLKGKTYWVDIDAILTGSDNRGFVAPGTFVAINSQIFRDSAPTGNYLKVMVEDHYFDLDTWKQLNFDPGSPLAAVTDASQLAGKEISSADTFLKVFINDKYRGLITVNHLLGTLLQPVTDQIYTAFEKDPRTVFSWDNSIWNRLKGENPWIGMTKDMLLVQKQERADTVTKTATRFTVFELWVYEYQYADSVYMFDGDNLIGMW